MLNDMVTITTRLVSEKPNVKAKVSTRKVKIIKEPSGLSAWLVAARLFAIHRISKNISPSDGKPGSVIASPSASNPNYYFHWVRDAARTMRMFVSLSQEVSQKEKENCYSTLKEYVEFSTINQTTPVLSHSLGEPKFYVTGEAFNGPWGRPQNDGPAERAITLIRWACLMLNENENVSYVTSILYSGKPGLHSVIKTDLDFIANSWELSCFDLWEEVKGTHFYTRMLQRTALREGAKLALRLNDQKKSEYYNKQATKIEDAMSCFWDGSKNILIPTVNKESGLDYKISGVDVSIILGCIQGYSESFPFLTPISDQTMSSAYVIHNAFKSLYLINEKETDSFGEKIFPAIGRYPEDVYAGETGTDYGNPWFLCTLSLSTLCYMAAHLYKREKNILITDRNIQFLQMAIDFNPGNIHLKIGDVLKTGKRLSAVVEGLKKMGDAYLRRVQLHSAQEGSLSEQFDRNTGFMLSARDLTWSYVALVTSIDWRSKL